MAFGLGDDLSISISADTADFTAGAEAVESQLDDLNGEALQTAAALEILSNRADDAGDNVSQAGNKASVTSGQLSALSAATSAANTSFLGISATTWGSFIPAIVALSAALTPVIASLGGFVAIAGSIAGIGLLPVIGAIATETEFLKNEVTDLLSQLQSAFQPTINEAVFILHEFIIAFEEIIPELAEVQDALATLAFQFQELGLVIIEALPALVDLAVALTQEFLPPFVDLVEGALASAPDAIRNFVDIFRQMAPQFMDAAEALGEFLPELTAFGFTVLDVLGPALGTLFSIGTDVLEWVNQLDPAFQRTAAAASLLAPVISIIGGIAAQFIGSGTLIRGASRVIMGAIGAISTPVLAVAGAVATLAAIWTQNFGNIRTIAKNTFASVEKDIQRLKPVIRGFSDFWETILLPAIRSVTRILSNILGPLLDVIETKFNFLLDAVSGLITGGFDMLVDVALTLSKLFAGDIPGAVNIMVNSMKDGLIGILEFVFSWQRQFISTIVDTAVQAGSGMINALNQIPGVNLGNPEQLFADIQASKQAALQESRQQEQQAIETIQNIRVTVENGEIVAKMDERAERQMNQQRRRLNRNSNSSSAPR